MKAHRTQKLRGGSLLFEVAISAVMLGVALTLVAQAAVALKAQQRLAGQRAVASHTLQNAMERLATLSPAAREALHQTSLPIDEPATKRLAEAELTADVGAYRPAGEPPAQRVVLRITWRAVPEAEPASRTLAAFFYPVEGAAP
ncbi:MAG: hypothetical protein AAF790_12330 [Planctomycetota bacterium]